MDLLPSSPLRLVLLFTFTIWGTGQAEPTLSVNFPAGSTLQDFLPGGARAADGFDEIFSHDPGWTASIAPHGGLAFDYIPPPEAGEEAPYGGFTRLNLPRTLGEPACLRFRVAVELTALFGNILTIELGRLTELRDYKALSIAAGIVDRLDLVGAGQVKFGFSVTSRAPKVGIQPADLSPVEVRWYVNPTDVDTPYQGPGGSPHTLAAHASTLWVAGEMAFENRPRGDNFRATEIQSLRGRLSPPAGDKRIRVVLDEIMLEPIAKP